MTEKLSRTTAALIGLISLIAFGLSYNALRDVAAMYGQAGWWAVGWPLLIDLALVVFSLSAVRAALYQQSTWRQWSMVGLYTLATIGFNLVHAQPGWVGVAVAIVPPVTLFLSFESLMGMVRQDIERQAVQPMHKSPDKSRHIETRFETEQDIDLTTLGPQDRQPYLVQWLDQGLSKDDIAARFGKTVKTIERDIGGLNGKT